MRRWQTAVVVILVIALAATWQQGLFQDSIDDLRRYNAAASQPPLASDATEIEPAFDFRNISGSLPSSYSEPLIPVGVPGPDDRRVLAQRTVGLSGGVVSHGGVRVSIPAGALSGEADVSVLERLGEFRGWVGGEPVSVDHPAGPVLQPITVEWDVGHLSEFQQQVLVLVRWDEGVGDWVVPPEEPDYQVADGILTAQIADWSVTDWVTRSWDWVKDKTADGIGWVGDKLSNLTPSSLLQTVQEWMGRRVDAPRCERGPLPSWVEDTSEAGTGRSTAAIRLCFQAGLGQSVRARMSNNRVLGQAIQFTGGDGFTVAEKPGLDVSLSGIVRAAAFEVMTDRATVYLPPLKTVAVDVARPTGAGSHTIRFPNNTTLGTYLVDAASFGLSLLDISDYLPPQLNAVFELLFKCGFQQVNAIRSANGLRKTLEALIDVAVGCLKLVGDPDSPEGRQLALAMGDSSAADTIKRASKELASLAKTLKIPEFLGLLYDAATLEAAAPLQLFIQGQGHPDPLSGPDAPAEPSVPSPRSRFTDIQIDYDEIEAATGETPVILLVDTSGSMSEFASGRVKLESAKSELLGFLDNVSSTREIALRTYPSIGGNECNTGELRIGFSTKTFEMEAIVGALQADGQTPMAEALQAAVEDIRRSGFSEAEIALFSDGLANCAEPCEVANNIAATGIDIRVHTGAFVDSQEGQDILRCIANATGGTHLVSSGQESEFAEELGEFLERNSIPRLDVALEVPDVVVPSTDPAELQQRVEAVVRNDSNVAAKDVVVSLEVGGGPESTRRTVAIGNIAPGAEGSASWELRPSFGSVGADLALGVSVVADNTKKVVSTSDAVMVENPNIPEDAGPIVGVGQVVVMGDQLLTGVGSNSRDPDGSCRKGRDIGPLEVFGQESERSLACANALIAHLTAPDWAKGVDSQINQLAVLRDEGTRINGVILSIGATDLGLSELTQECVLSIVSCDSEISGVATEDWLEESIAGSGPRRNSVLSELVRSFGAIDQELNADRGESRQAPILLLAQPRAFSFVSGACFERWHGGGTPLLTQAELNLYHHFVSAVNGTLESAALAAQELGLPVLFVDATETAYLPDHTACSNQPYVRSLEPLFEAGLDSFATLVKQGIPGVVGEELNEDAVAEFSEEFLAPNLEGEQALANAVLRWSRSDEALIANNAMNDRFVQRSAGVAADLHNTSQNYEILTLGSEDSITLESGQGWNVKVSGFLPGSLVTASVEPSGRFIASSVADRRGTANLYMVLGPEEAALEEASIVVKGRGRSGAIVSGTQPVEVLPPLRPLYSLILPALAALLLLGSLLLWRASRRQVE